MMKLIYSAFVSGAIAASAAPLRGLQDDVAPPSVVPLPGMPPIPPVDADTVKYLSPEPTRVSLLYSSMDTEFSNFMTNQVIPLLAGQCGHFLHMEWVPFGNCSRVPHPWHQTKYVYQCPRGNIELIQNTQQLCTLDAYSNIPEGWEKIACLQALASQDPQDSRGEDWFDSGENMKTCFGSSSVKEFRQIIDCSNSESRLEYLLDEAVFKTYHYGVEKNLPSLLINYQPANFTKASTDLRTTLCDMDVNKNWSCCNYDDEKEKQESDWANKVRQFTKYAQEKVRGGQVSGKKDIDVLDMSQKVYNSFPGEIQDMIADRRKDDHYITDNDVASEKILKQIQ